MTTNRILENDGHPPRRNRVAHVIVGSKKTSKRTLFGQGSIKGELVPSLGEKSSMPAVRVAALPSRIRKATCRAPSSTTGIRLVIIEFASDSAHRSLSPG